jgi:hypothetical protein
VAPDRDGAGEEHLADPVGLAERLADRPAAVDHPHQALGDPGPLEHVADPLAQQRRQAGGLQHHAVARGERDHDLVERDRPRVVPR